MNRLREEIKKYRATNPENLVMIKGTTLERWLDMIEEHTRETLYKRDCIEGKIQEMEELLQDVLFVATDRDNDR